MNTSQPETLLEALCISLRAASRHASSEVAPAAILWTDPDSQWKPIIPQLRLMLPELTVFGDYDPEQMQGPAIWIRCVIEGALPEINIPEGLTPIIYISDESRQTLRAAEDCPWLLQPMVELQYRGTVWCQRNGRDWTVEAFLVSDDGGLELDVAKDQQTHRAMLGSLTQLAVFPVSRLRNKRLEAEDFDRLMIEDTPRELLTWLSDPRGVREKWDDSLWDAFCARCQSEYGFDPKSDGELTGGELLGHHENAWLGVWERFAESPRLYPGIPDLLKRVKPVTEMFLKKESWPDENDKAEIELRGELAGFENLSPEEARGRISELEKEHSIRRTWVWAKMGLSPLADSLQYLSALGRYTENVIGGESPKAMADRYVSEGYMADDVVIRAMACVKSVEDSSAVSAAVRSLYLVWLNETTVHFQNLVQATPLTASEPEMGPISAGAGDCLLFFDAFRFDFSQRFIGLAEERGLRIQKNWRWAAIPTVTSTAKPAISPVAEQLIGNQLPEDFSPQIKGTDQASSSRLLSKLIAEEGYQILESSDLGLPGPEERGWSEIGEFDKLGHSLESKISGQVKEQLELLVQRVQNLLDQGWRRVRIVTDHGWLLMPGGLPSVSLPSYLTESRWSRCAAVKKTAQVDVPVFSWYWNDSEHVASAPGASAFSKGHEYSHGGVSLQECVIPDLIIWREESLTWGAVIIKEIKWAGLRCRITVEPAGSDLFVDIRTKVNDPSSSITATKTFKKLDEAGKAALLIKDETYEGQTVSLVIMDPSGNVVIKQATTVGGED